jgi:hypothetical protein
MGGRPQAAVHHVAEARAVLERGVPRPQLGDVVVDRRGRAGPLTRTYPGEVTGPLRDMERHRLPDPVVLPLRGVAQTTRLRSGVAPSAMPSRS